MTKSGIPLNKIDKISKSKTLNFNFRKKEALRIANSNYVIAKKLLSQSVSSDLSSN